MMKVRLNDIKEIQDFVNRCSMFEEDVFLKSERYVVNAKSIMGILSLDLSKEIEVDIDTDKPSSRKVFEDFIKKYR